MPKNRKTPKGSKPAPKAHKHPHVPAGNGVRPAAAPRPPRPAAGLLIHYVAPDGHPWHVDSTDWWLLGLRTRRLGGTWSNIGGSLEPGETDLAGAAREFLEETQIPAHRLTGATIADAVSCGTDDRPYTMFVIDVTEPFDDAVLGWENDELLWLTTAEVHALDRRGLLHEGFARGWDLVLDHLEDRSSS